MNKLPREEELRRLQVYIDCGYSANKASKVLGVDRRAMDRFVARMQREGLIQQDEITRAAQAAGVDDIRNISHFWRIIKDDDGSGYSVFVKNPDTGGEKSFQEMLQGALDDFAKNKAPKYPKRKVVKGDHLLVIDLCDVHFRKLSVKTETGYEYNRDVARHRVIEGTKALLEYATKFPIERVLYVLGNDILNTDGATSATTSGTPQRSEGSPFQAYSDAFSCLVESIEEVAQVADVDLYHCMSNHDFFAGWALSRQVGTHFNRHPNVFSNDYTLSERHRKYYRYGNSLIGLSHGDGAKEENLYAIMVAEQRKHVGEAKNLYFLLHHLHHKIRRNRGIGKPVLREKDHYNMTVINSHQNTVEGDDLQVEYVRAASPPEDWHDRNGFLNRQGVECFLFHRTDGMKARFTEWF